MNLGKPKDYIHGWLGLLSSKGKFWIANNWPLRYKQPPCELKALVINLQLPIMHQ